MHIIEQWKSKANINEFGLVLSDCDGLVEKLCGYVGVSDTGSIRDTVCNMDKSRPRVISRRAALTGVRTKNSHNGRLYEKLKAYADKCIQNPVVTRRDAKSNLMFAREMLDRAFVFGFMHLNEGGGYAPFLKCQMLEALGLYKTFDLKNSDDVLPCSELTVALCIAYDWIYETLSESEKQEIRDAVAVHGEVSSSFYAPPISDNAAQVNNWNAVFNGANIIAGLVMYGEDKSGLWEKLLAGAVRSIVLSVSEFAPDGGFPEGVGYWVYQTQYTVYALSSLESALGTDFNLSEMPGMEKTGLFPIYLHNNSFLPFNYSDASIYPAVTAFMNWFGAKFGIPEIFSYNDAVNPEGVNYEHWVGAHYDIITMLFREDAPSGAFKSLPGSFSFKGRQQAMTIRSSWEKDGAFLGFKGGYNQLPHCNLDIGTFVYDRNGVRWFTEINGENYAAEGFWDFAWGRWMYYSQRAEGHNTIAVNPANEPDQYIYASAAVDFVKDNEGVVDITKAYPDLKSGSRRFCLDGETAVITDKLCLKKESDVYWFFHTKADIEITSENTALLSCDGKKIKVEFDLPDGAGLSVMDAKSVVLTKSTNHTETDGIRKLCVRVRADGEIILVTKIM